MPEEITTENEQEWARGLREGRRAERTPERGGPAGMGAGAGSITSQLRELKEGNRVRAAAELGMRAAEKAPYIGQALMAGRMLEKIGIPGRKILIVSVVLLVLILALIIVTGIYMFLNKWSLIWDFKWDIIKDEASNLIKFIRGN